MDEIVVAAVALIDRDGLDSFSMRGLASEMDVFPNVLYRRTSNREQLLDLVANHLIAAVEHPDSDQEPGSWLLHYAQALRASIRAHPEAAALIATVTGPQPAIQDMFEGILAAFARAGLDGEERVVALTTYAGFVIGANLTTLLTRHPAGDPPRARPPVFDPRRYPFLANLVAVLAERSDVNDTDAMEAFSTEVFTRGLVKLLDGLGVPVTAPVGGR